MLSPFPHLLSLSLSLYIYIHLHSTATHTCTFFSEKSTRFYWNAWANKKVFRWDLNWDNVGTFLRVASSEFQRDGAMKLKEHCLNDLSFRFGILSSFSLKDQRYIYIYVFLSLLIDWVIAWFSGCGKTMLMDMFYNSSERQRKKRVHFHKFMLDVHRREWTFSEAWCSLLLVLTVSTGFIFCTSRT